VNVSSFVMPFQCANRSEILFRKDFEAFYVVISSLQVRLGCLSELPQASLPEHPLVAYSVDSLANQALADVAASLVVEMLQRHEVRQTFHSEGWKAVGRYLQSRSLGCET
jgi:hypothetical protein